MYHAGTAYSGKKPPFNNQPHLLLIPRTVQHSKNLKNRTNSILYIRYFKLNKTKNCVPHNLKCVTVSCDIPNLLLRQLAVISYIVSVLIVYIGGLHGAQKLFSQLFSRILGAPQSFFDRQPRGRILDRLSNDVYKLDMVLPEITRVFLSQAFRVCCPTNCARD